MRKKRVAGARGGAGPRAETGAAAGPAGVVAMAAEARMPLAAAEGHMPGAGVGAQVPLASAEAHLWWARPAAFGEGAQLARLRALLTDDECARADRYRVARDRRTSLVTRALVRTVLSRYSGVPSGRWRFRTNEHGRPEIASPASPLRFNVSHTDGLVVCLVGRDASSASTRRTWAETGAGSISRSGSSRRPRRALCARRRRRGGGCGSSSTGP